MSRRGIMNKDAMVPYQLADGRTIMLPDKAVTQVEEFLDKTMSVGKAVGAAETGALTHFTREAEFKRLTRGKAQYAPSEADGAVLQAVAYIVNEWKNLDVQKERGTKILLKEEHTLKGIATVYAKTFGFIGTAAVAGAVMQGGVIGAALGGFAAYGVLNAYVWHLGAEASPSQIKLRNARKEMNDNWLQAEGAKPGAIDPLELQRMINETQAKRRQLLEKQMQMVTDVKRRKLAKQMEDNDHLTAFNQIMNVEKSEDWLGANPQAILTGLQKLEEAVDKKYTIDETTFKDLVVTFFGRTMAEVTDNVLRYMLSPTHMVKNVHAYHKMHVTAGGPFLPTTQYFNGNFIGGIQQTMLGFGVNRHFTSLGLGAYVGGTIGTSVAGPFGGMVGALGGAIAGPIVARGVGGFGTSAGPLVARSLKSIGRGLQIPVVMNLLFDYQGEALVWPGAVAGLGTGFLAGGGMVGGVVGAVAGGVLGYKASKKIKGFAKKKVNLQIPPVVTPSGRIYTMKEIARDMQRFGAGSSFLKEETSALFATDFRAHLKNTVSHQVLYYGGGKGFLELFMELADSKK